MLKPVTVTMLGIFFIFSTYVTPASVLTIGDLCPFSFLPVQLHGYQRPGFLFLWSSITSLFSTWSSSALIFSVSFLLIVWGLSSLHCPVSLGGGVSVIGELTQQPPAPWAPKWLGLTPSRVKCVKLQTSSWLKEEAAPVFLLCGYWTPSIWGCVYFPI